jgi:phosphoribosylanthranilate isomerase
VLVKICGITNEADALLAIALGADALGFLFAPSARQVTAPIVREIVGRLPPGILTLGVFRDEDPHRLIDTVYAAGLRGAQLHGHETPEITRHVRSQVPFVIQAFPAGSAALAHAAEHGADLVMIDGATPGSGKVFDWSLAATVPMGLSVVLAGGLTPDNVGAAIAQVEPYGVDVSTGVEREPGRKDPVKLRAFIAAARAAEAELDAEHDNERAERADARTVSMPYDWSDDE